MQVPKILSRVVPTKHVKSVASEGRGVETPSRRRLTLHRGPVPRPGVAVEDHQLVAVGSSTPDEDLSPDLGRRMTGARTRSATLRPDDSPLQLQRCRKNRNRNGK